MSQSFDARAAIGTYVFAENWAQAREIVQSNPWYSADAAEAEMALLIEQAREAAAENPEGAASMLALFELAGRRLKVLRGHGSEEAFGDLAAFDERLEALAQASSLDELLVKFSNDDSLTGEQALAGLRHLAVRASATGDTERGNSFFQLAVLVQQIRAAGLTSLADDAAKAIYADLQTILPQSAGADDVAQAERALACLEHAHGSPLWLGLQARLGSFLLECPDGDRAENVRRAEAAYRAVLARVTVDQDPDSWEIGIAGLANSLASEPTGPARMNEAQELFEVLIERLRLRRSAMRLAQVAGNYARLLANLTYGDRDSHLERAIELQREAVKELNPENDRPANEPAAWGRALHNLAGFYAQRRTGVRSQNVDLAVQALEKALSVRTAQVDPVGRVRSLRALESLYPDWTGADSLDHGSYLAQAAADEAAAIERADPRAAARAAGRASLGRQASALRVDLDANLRLDRDDLAAWLKGAIENHVAACNTISAKAEPALWADWAGGLARILGRVSVIGIEDRSEEACSLFRQAIAVAAPLERPRLLHDLQARWGELSHELGDWENSLQAFSAAVSITYGLFDAFAARESRFVELKETRGHALCAAYAAYRLGRLDEAIQLAEVQRGRSLVDLTVAAEALPGATREQRERIADLMAQIGTLEAQIGSDLGNDPEGMLAQIRGRLADHLGTNEIGIRLTRFEEEGIDEAAAKRKELTESLALARKKLREVVVEANSVRVGMNAEQFTFDDIAAVARVIGRPLVYLLATRHGGAALIVPPGGSPHAVDLEVTSREALDLLHGDDERPGFARGAFQGDAEVLGVSLDRCLPILRQKVMGPLEQRLGADGRSNAVLVPLGRLGLLPLHAAGERGFIYSYAPSARALSMAVSTRPQKPETRRLLIVGEPAHEEQPALPFAVAEARVIGAIATAAASEAVTVLVREQADAASVTEAACDCTLMHLACHGSFRPSAPLESSLLLAADDRLTVADLFSRKLDLSKAGLVSLSACQTGSVEYYQTPDEAIGFPVALLLAGVPCVLTALWPVDDLATALLCADWYQRILGGGEDYGRALENARHWLRHATPRDLQQAVKRLRDVLEESDGDSEAELSNRWRDFAFRPPDGPPPFAAPEYWAGFALTGAY